MSTLNNASAAPADTNIVTIWLSCNIMMRAILGGLL